MYANKVPKMTTIAFRPNDKYFLNSFFHTDSSSISRKLFLYFIFWNEELTNDRNHWNQHFTNPNQLDFKFTFNSNKTTMVKAPSNVSHNWVSLICVITAIHDSIKAFVEPLMPSSDFTWLLPIVNAAAVVKPTVTWWMNVVHDNISFMISAMFVCLLI